MRRAILGLSLCLVLSESGSAQSIRLDQYTPPLISEDGLKLSRALALDAGATSVLLVFDYAGDPLVLQLPDARTTVEASLVERHAQAGLRVAYGLAERLTLVAGLDFIALMSGERVVISTTREVVDPAQGAGFGDARVGMRYLAIGNRRSRAAAGLQAQLSFPLAHWTSSDGRLYGESSVAFAPELILELRPSVFRLTANAGFLLREGMRVVTNQLGHAFTFGLGAAAAIPSGGVQLELIGEFHGSTSFNQTFASGVTPYEALFGARLQPHPSWRISLGAGPGLADAIGSPAFRMLASVGFVAADRRANDEEPPPSVCPTSGASDDPACRESDADGDGVADARDACRNDAEDRDGFQDEDGCPDNDNDGDHIADLSDKCPNEAEDRDGFQDEDGCPELDNDADGIADAQDGCPNQAEDRDGFQDQDGCPDPDNDGDGLADADDACPSEPGRPEQKGCALTKVLGDQLQVLQRIEFAKNTSTLLSSSEPILEEIRATLQDNPQLRRVAVEGHSDSAGSAQRNRVVSGKRAESVVRWLTQHGIPALRLEAWGCGSAHPLASNDTEDGRQQNRRVEFRIVDPAPDNARDPMGCQTVPRR